jgi:hypothetical protein
MGQDNSFLFKLTLSFLCFKIQTNCVDYGNFKPISNGWKHIMLILWFEHNPSSRKEHSLNVIFEVGIL